MADCNKSQNVEREPKSCLPEKVPLFASRKLEIRELTSILMEKERAIVSLHGGPGFGKTAIAVEVAHKLSGDYNIPVIFSHLSTATTVDEMIRRMCRDVGINYEDDPKSSLILWLKNIKKKVVFVLDDIDKLLEEKTHLFEFLRLMQKNSHQHCQIVTTSRMFYSIPELSTSVKISEMDDVSAMDLLRQRCPDQDGKFLRKLAQLCGHIPLAMCIAGSRADDFEDPNELLQHIDQQPMETLECPESDLFVYRAINMSYEMLENEKKESLARLAAFAGSFTEVAARAVIERSDLETKRILKDLVHRSLIKQPIQHRYSVHLLIRCFLNDQLESEENRSHAETLMVKYYLDLGHELTIKSYSKDGYKANREALKKEAQNMQNVLKICCQQDDITSDVSTSLTTSKIYNTSARFFSIFIRTIIPGSTVDEFLQCCATLAEERMQHAIKINFDCLLADKERGKRIGNSDKYFKKMDEINEEFENYYETFKEDKSLCAHYYYQYGRYLLRKCEADNRIDLIPKGREQLEKSLSLREDSNGTSEEKADMVFSLLHLGNLCRKSSTIDYVNKQTEAYKKSMESAKTFYRKAIEISETYLGDHELTSACYKTFGDYFLLSRNTKEAKENYVIAKNMREKLDLDGSEKHVYLLNNLGKCLTFSKREREAIDLLQNACEMAEKLAENDEPNQCQAKVYTSLAIAHNSVRRSSEDAVNYAKKALKFNEIYNVVKRYELQKLREISSMQRW